MKFPLKQFNQFCASLKIDSKELGQITLAQQIGTQRYVIEQIVRGLEDDIHWFVFLKARQLGVTTITLALDLFWHFMFPGWQGTLAADCEDNRDMFRSTLSMYHDGLPKSHRIPIIQNNRNFISFKNRSRIFMQIGGGGKKKGGKGRGKGLSYMHATECSSWEDEESLISIIASLAETNPNRLYIFESTARGANLYKDIWDDAKNAVSQRAIFVGWWLNELYRKEKDSNEYRVYWDGKHTPVEREWIRAVKLMYKYDVTPEQMAWWRWKLAEGIHDENLMMQEYPPHEELAFILTGKNFFSLTKVQEISDRIEREVPPTYYRFKFGNNFLETELEEVNEKMGHLTIWEEPDDAGVYVIGGDPAYGSETWKDRFALEVYRCYADRLEQVAELCTPDLTTYKFAWVICYLAGAYKNSFLNIEVNGPGQAVLQEMENIRQQSGMLGRTPEGKALRDVVGHMKYYLYRRLDSIGGVTAYHWQSNAKNKEWALNTFKDLIDKNICVIHSKTLADEMKVVVREENGFIGASGRKKDDCTIASAIASIQYMNPILNKLKQAGVTWNKELERRIRSEEVGRNLTPQEQAISRNVSNYLSQIGMKHKVNG